MNGPEPRTVIEVDKYDNDIVFEKGDFALIYRGKAITPSTLGTIYSSATVARREAAQMFAGVVANASAAGDSNKIRIDIGLESYFKLAQNAAGAMSVADFIGIKATGSGVAWGLEDQQIEGDCSYPIAVIVQSKSSTGTDVLAKLLPQKLFNAVHSYAICDGESALSYAG